MNIGDRYKILCNRCKDNYHTVEYTSVDDHFFNFKVINRCRCEVNLIGIGLPVFGRTIDDLIPELSENDIEFYTKVIKSE